MGNQVPDIFLTYEHELYFAGETLTGQASFRVPVGAVVDFSSIKLTFTGGEYTIVHYTRDIGSGEKRRTIKRIAYGKRNLYYNELPVIPSQITGREHAAGQGQGYVFGDITIPFSIDLPHGLPSTMELGKEKNTCSIKYTLAVEVHGVAIANKAVNIVQMPRMLPIQPTIIDPEIQAIRCCCFAVDCGAIALGASLQQPCIAIGSEACPLRCIIMNNATAKIKELKVMLHMACKFNAEGYDASFRGAICTVTINREELQGAHQLKVVSKGQVSPGTTEMLESMLHEMRLGMHSEEGSQRAHHQALLTVNLTVPTEFAYPTYPGTLIQTSHWLEIELITGLCTSNPVITSQVVVQPNGLEAFLIPLALQGGSILDIDRKSYLANNNMSPPCFTPFPSDWHPILRESILFGQDHAVVGGTREDTSALSTDVPPLFPPPVLPVQRSITVHWMLEELEKSIDDLGVIHRCLVGGQSEEFRAEIRTLAPKQFALITKHVRLPVDQPLAALLLARAIRERGGSFRCIYIVAVLRVCSRLVRVDMVQCLLLLCEDYEKEKARRSVRSELSLFEQLRCDAVINPSESHSTSLYRGV